MVEIGKPMLAVYLAAALAIALIGARYLQAQAGARSASERPVTSFVPAGSHSAGGATTAASGSARRLVLHVTGAVRRPGLVEMGEGDRVGDAIRMAGGPRGDADLSAVNLAMLVADGQQVVVPDRSAGVATGSGGSGTPDVQGPVSLNSATVEQLDELDGVGPGLAEKIVAERQRRGGFRSVDGLAEVPGIGEKRLESLRAQLQP
jgi:competence protein ComEA